MLGPVRTPCYRTLVFDWDGTLIDSIATIVACTQATLVELGLPPADESSLRRAIGLGIDEMVESICPGCSEETFASIVRVYRRLWFGGFAGEPTVFEGVVETLTTLGDQGCLLAIATAKSRKGLSADLERTGLGDFFAASRTADEAASKPNPAMIEELLAELGARRAETLMIGDAVHDLEMATNAGVASVGVTSGTASREALLASRPLTLLDTVVELPGWLERRADRSTQSSEVETA